MTSNTGEDDAVNGGGRAAPLGKARPEPPTAGGGKPASRAGRGVSALSDATREIEDNLRRVYQARLNEPVPDRFADLLAQLRAGEAKP